MRYIIEAKSNRTNGRIFVAATSDEVYPEKLTFHRERAYTFDTNADEDMGDALRLAREVYGLKFEVVPVCPAMTQEQFDHFRGEIESATLNAYYGRLLDNFTMGQAVMVHAECARAALHAVPCFLNADVLRDYSNKLGEFLARHIRAAEMGIHEYAQRNRAS